jgi:actin cytoskeleton-regulatory complex protein END3
MFTSPRYLLLAVAVAGTALFAQVASADGNKKFPSFDSISGGDKMLARDEVTPKLEKKYPALTDLKEHWDDADMDHDGNINQHEYEAFMTLPKD